MNISKCNSSKSISYAKTLVPNNPKSWTFIVIGVGVVALSAIQFGTTKASLVGLLSMSGYTVFKLNLDPRSSMNINAHSRNRNLNDHVLRNAPAPHLRIDASEEDHFLKLDNILQALPSIKKETCLDARILKIGISSLPNISKFNFLQFPNVPIETLAENACKLNRDKNCIIVTNTGDHYILLEIDWQNDVIRKYDSKLNFNPEETQKIINTCKDIVSQQTGIKLEEEHPLTEIFQDNQTDCGPWCYYFAKKITEGAEAFPKPEDPRATANFMRKELIKATRQRFSELNTTIQNARENQNPEQLKRLPKLQYDINEALEKIGGETL